MKSGLVRSPYIFLILALLLFFPAFMINLEYEPVGEDEAIRALVAFEMDKSGDYITPTIGGTPYMKKPPLYNWIIAGSYKLFGNYSEMAIRFPMIISLLLFSATIFFFIRKELGKKLAILNALIFLTTGRIIIYESLMGLIDMTFSWLSYLFFMLAYFLFKKEKFLLLFIMAYLIAAITWMMKGLPSITFLLISLLVLFVSGKRFHMLFSWRHFTGMFIFLLLVGGYYLIYFNLNPETSPETLFMTLLEQSTRRTVVRFGLMKTILHFFAFPLEMLYHFLPWTLLTLGLFVGGSIKKAWAHRFLRYNILILCFNIILYWASPEVYPRYILMLLPLCFAVVSWVYTDLQERGAKAAKVIEYIFGATLILAGIAPWASPYVEMVKDVDHVLLISAILSIVLATISMIFWISRQYRLFWFAIAILVLRIGFDFLIHPTRQVNSDPAASKVLAYSLAEKTKGKPLYSYWNKNTVGLDFWYLKNCVSF
ncbi:MAG: glycosyltransferase family 39 protein [Bacteroidales bacterium]|nr:glycosyltransferase family 39 protein [Bacteroidales bacterium]